MDEISIQELFGMVLKRVWIVSIIFFVAVAGTAVVMYGYMEDEYTSEASLFIRNEKDEQINYNDLLAGEKLVPDYKRMVMGNVIMDAAAKDVGLEEINLEAVEVTTETASRILTVKVTDPSPEMAYKQVTAIMREFENEIKLAMDAKNVNIRVTNKPVVPLEPSGPPRMRNTAIGALVGLMLGIGLAMFLGMMDTTLNTAEDVERALNLPVLAIVPRYKKPREVAAREAERSTVKL